METFVYNIIHYPDRIIRRKTNDKEEKTKKGF